MAQFLHKVNVVGLAKLFDSIIAFLPNGFWVLLEAKLDNWVTLVDLSEDSHGIASNKKNQLYFERSEFFFFLLSKVKRLPKDVKF